MGCCKSRRARIHGIPDAPVQHVRGPFKPPCGINMIGRGVRLIFEKGQVQKGSGLTSLCVDREGNPLIVLENDDRRLDLISSTESSKITTIEFPDAKTMLLELPCGVTADRDFPPQIQTTVEISCEDSRNVRSTSKHGREGKLGVSIDATMTNAQIGASLGGYSELQKHMDKGGGHLFVTIIMPVAFMRAGGSDPVTCQTTYIKGVIIGVEATAKIHVKTGGTSDTTANQAGGDVSLGMKAWAVPQASIGGNYDSSKTSVQNSTVSKCEFSGNVDFDYQSFRNKPLTEVLSAMIARCQASKLIPGSWVVMYVDVANASSRVEGVSQLEACTEAAQDLRELESHIEEFDTKFPDLKTCQARLHANETLMSMRKYDLGEKLEAYKRISKKSLLEQTIKDASALGVDNDKIKKAKVELKVFKGNADISRSPITKRVPPRDFWSEQSDEVYPGDIIDWCVNTHFSSDDHDIRFQFTCEGVVKSNSHIKIKQEGRERITTKCRLQFYFDNKYSVFTGKSASLSWKIYRFD